MQQLPESGIARQISAQNQRVRKEPDQLLRFHTVPIGDWDSHEEVFLSCIAEQQGLEGRQQSS